MVKILFCDVSHLNKHGINSIELIWNTEVAVFRYQLSYANDGGRSHHYSIASPTDWYWLTEVGLRFDRDLAENEVCSEVLEALQSAKQAWKSARRAARLVGLDWMDKAYFKVAPMEYNDVFVRHNDAPFVVTQYFGIQLISCGEFAARLLRGYDWKFEHEDFVLTESNPRVIYVDIREDRSDLKTFIEQPEKFDGDAVKKVIECNGIRFRLDGGFREVVSETRDFEIDIYITFIEKPEKFDGNAVKKVIECNGIRFRLDGGFREVVSETRDFEIELDREGHVIMPRYEVGFPYACLVKYAGDIRLMIRK